MQWNIEVIGGSVDRDLSLINPQFLSKAGKLFIAAFWHFHNSLIIKASYAYTYTARRCDPSSFLRLDLALVRCQLYRIGTAPDHALDRSGMPCARDPADAVEDEKRFSPRPKMTICARASQPGHSFRIDLHHEGAERNLFAMPPLKPTTRGHALMSAPRIEETSITALLTN